MDNKEITSKESLIEILDLLENLKIRYWVDGGWGIDILIGKQTREHRDVDIDFDGEYTDVLLNKLKEKGYTVTTDWSPSRIELHHPNKGYIDIHPLEINKNGTAKQADLNDGWYHFESEWFSTSVFEGRTIPCISSKAQRLFHSGYELREIDKIDIANLDSILSEKDI